MSATTMPAPEDNLAGLEEDYQARAARAAAIPPEFRTPQPSPRQGRSIDPSVEAAINQLPERVRPIALAEYDSLMRRGEGGAAAATAQRDLTLARGEREAREAFAGQQRAELQRYRGARVELPDFVPTQENALSIGTLFGLLGVVGTMMGNKGQQSAVAAMNAMGGMLAGWRQGRADLYNRERQQFEIQMKRVQEQNAVLQRDFQDALNVMKTDLDAGLARAREAAARHGVSIAGAAAARQGAEGIRNFLQGLRSSMMQIEQTQSRASNQAPIVVPQRDADGNVRYFYAHRDGSLLQQNGQPVEAPAPRSAFAAGSATMMRQRADIRGQIRLLEAYMTPQEVENLGTREIPAVTSRIESAELSSRLAEEVRRNPQSAGLAARMIRRLEVLDPSRYGGNEQGAGFLNWVSSFFGSSIDNQSIEGPADAVTKARQIAKLAVDVINARALAASGGSRMLVSELNLQKGVIGLEGLTPESGAAVYQRLADDDIASMRRYGISYERLAEIKSTVNDKAREYVRSGGLMSSERSRSATPSSGQTQESLVATAQDIAATLAANPNMTRNQVIQALRARGFEIEGE